MNGRHRILRQVLELDLRVPLEAAAALQEHAARPFRDGALPDLEALFDRLAGSDRLIRLERLELDLGELRGRDWPSQLLERLAEQLAERLQEALPAAGVAGADDSGAASPAPGADSPISSRSAAAPAGRDPLAALLYFLENGRLPWWGTRDASNWDAAPAAAFAAGPGWRIGELLRSRPALAERLQAVAGDRLLAALLAALTGLGSAEEALHRLAPEGVAPGGPRWPGWRRTFWTGLLAAAPGLRLEGASGAALLRRWLAERPPQRAAGDDAPAFPPLPSPWREWKAAAEATPTDPAPAAPGAAAPSASRLDQQAPPSGAPSGASRSDDARDAPPGAGLGHQEIPTPGAATSSAGRLDELTGIALPAVAGLSPGAAPPGASRLAERAAGSPRAGAAVRLGAREEVYLTGAGLVILHPFLPELLAGRGLLENKQRFRGESERRHAARLLGQLVFGAAAAEYDLLLPKLLCGLAWEEVLAPAEPDEQDAAACGELLAAVLRHWTALKSSSPDWLRQQFLLRDGKLEPADGGFRLTVENRAQDVLLARLPWGFGTVRLPWLAANLHVTWID